METSPPKGLICVVWQWGVIRTFLIKQEWLRRYMRKTLQPQGHCGRLCGRCEGVSPWCWDRSKSARAIALKSSGKSIKDDGNTEEEKAGMALEVPSLCYWSIFSMVKSVASKDHSGHGDWRRADSKRPEAMTMTQKQWLVACTMW